MTELSWQLPLRDIDWTIPYPSRMSPELLPLVLPALVAVEQGSSHLPFPSSERVLHPLADLREVGTRRYAVADDPPAVEVHHRRQVELPVRKLELRDVRDELAVRGAGGEISAEPVVRDSPYLSPVRAVRSSLLARLSLQQEGMHDSLDLLVVDPLPVSPRPATGCYILLWLAFELL